MKRFTYDGRDYAFGQAMLTLRTHIGLTQAGLAEQLGVSRRAVAEWEAGSAYPKAERLKLLIALGIQQQAFPAGREAEEIRALWKAAHQKLLLDELWLAELLSQQHPPPLFAMPQPIEQTIARDQAVVQSARGLRVDWDDAHNRAGRYTTTAQPLLDIPFVGRGAEVSRLMRLYEQASSGQPQVVLLEGEAGIGKTRLAAAFLDWVKAQGAEVLEGRAFQTSQRLSYQPLIEALRTRLAQEHDLRQLMSDPWLAELSRLLPDLRERYPNLPPLTINGPFALSRLSSFLPTTCSGWTEQLWTCSSILLDIGRSIRRPPCCC